jgi:membrane fusion protein, multidrug efflux system
MKMTRHTSLTAGITSLVVVGTALLLTACGSSDEAEKEQERQHLAQAQEIAIPVRTLPASGGTVVESLSVQGRLEVWRQEILSAPVAGIIRQFPTLPDQPVKTGDLVLLLDPPLSEVDEIAKATIQRGRTRRALDRLEYLRINAPVTVSTNDLETARDAESDATRELELLTNRQAKRRIVAPFAGVLVKFEGVVGAQIAEGTKFAELLDHSRYRIRLELPETTLRRLQIGQTVEVRALSDDTSATGTVASIPAAIDTEKGTGQVVIDTTTPPTSWRPGGFATAKLVLKETTGAVVLPRDKVFFEENRAFCWTAETRDGKLVARRAWIDTGASDETKLIVTKGVNAGDQVIVEGLAGMSDGVKIVLAPEKKDESKKEEKKEDKKESEKKGAAATPDATKPAESTK